MNDGSFLAIDVAGQLTALFVSGHPFDLFRTTHQNKSSGPVVTGGGILDGCGPPSLIISGGGAGAATGASVATGALALSLALLILSFSPAALASVAAATGCGAGSSSSD